MLGYELELEQSSADGKRGVVSTSLSSSCIVASNSETKSETGRSMIYDIVRDYDSLIPPAHVLIPTLLPFISHAVAVLTLSDMSNSRPRLAPKPHQWRTIMYLK